MEVEKLRRDYDVQADWQPFFLRPETPPEGLALPERIRARMRDPNNPLKQRAAREGLTMIEREVIPSTRRAHEAAEFARARGKLEPMHAELLRRYWSEGQDLYALSTLRGAATAAGLDAEELELAITAGSYREAVERAVEEAQEMGVRAVPTFLFDDRLALEGAQEYPVFKQVMARLGAAPRATDG